MAGAAPVAGGAVLVVLCVGATGELRTSLRRRRVRHRVAAASHEGSRGEAGRAVPFAAFGVLEVLGTTVERLVAAFGLVAESTAPTATDTPPGAEPHMRARWTGGVVVLGCALMVVSPPVAVLTSAVAFALPRRLALGRADRRTAGIERELPAVVELLAVAARAGLTVPEAIAVVSSHVGGEVGPALRGAAEAGSRGLLLADSLAAIADELGPPLRPLVSVLVAAVRDGDPLAPALDRLAERLHHSRQRRAEVVARRLSVQLLVPLVLCVLPAFALLTVVPLLISSFGSLPR